MTMRFLRISDDNKPKLIITSESKSLEALQKGVGGYVERIQLNPALDMWINEEGLFDSRCRPNFMATWLVLVSGRGDTSLLIHGPVVITGRNGVETGEVPAEFVNKITDTLRVPKLIGE